jgi:hypothetical protein
MLNKHLEYIKKGFLSAVLMLVAGISIAALIMEVFSLAYRHPMIGIPSLLLPYLLAWAWVLGRHK